MTTQFSLQTLLELAQSRTTSAARQLGQLCSREHSEDEKLKMLIEYRLDYQASFQQAMRDGVSPAGWRNYQEFMNKLDFAVKQQTEVVAHWQRQAQVSRAEWEAEQRRLKSYDTLHERHQRSESRRANRAEQKEQDEYPSSGHLRLIGNE
jgi:flagellar protein FliJ